MLGLGILLIAAPAALKDLRVVRVLLVGSIGLSGLVARGRPHSAYADGLLTKYRIAILAANQP